MRLCVGTVLCLALLVPSAAGAQADCDLGCQLERFLRGILEGIFGEGGPSGPAPDAPTEPGAESTGCGPGADFCFRRPGLFHHVTRGDPVEAIRLPISPGTYRSLRVSFDARNGGPLSSRGPRYTEQLMFWLAVTNHYNLYGFVRLRSVGPRYELSNTHGVRVPFERKQKETAGLHFPFGAVYHFDYLYDAAARRITLTVTDGQGNGKASIVGRPNVGRVRMPAASREVFHLTFGYGDRENRNEFESYGWRFSNLVVEAFE